MDKKQITKLGAILYSYLNLSDWTEIFRLSDLEHYFDNHPRFKRSLTFDDPDAKENCFKATEFLYSHNPRELLSYIKKYSRIMQTIKQEIPSLLPQIVSDGEIRPIDIKDIASQSQTLKEAIDDAEILIAAGKPANAYDRIYTALHGVLKEKCFEMNIQIEERANLTFILTMLRKHILNNKASDKAKEAAKIFSSIIKIIEILNNMRNKNSLAHPNKELLENDEALFFINISKAIMRYVSDIIK